MAARALRRYKITAANIGAWNNVMPAVVPNNRALVIGRVVVTTMSGGPVKFALGCGAGSGAPRAVSDGQIVAPAEEYINGGFILIAGDQFEVYPYDGVAGTLYVAAFGEEVDN